MIDETHSPSRASWVASAQNHPDFPFQNLPLGVFSPSGGRPRGGIAIGDSILDIPAVLGAGLLEGAAREAGALASGEALNPLLAAGVAPRVALRRRICQVLSDPQFAALKSDILHPAASCQMLLPLHVSNFTDFFAGTHHATTAGMITRPDNPLMPNY